MFKIQFEKYIENHIDDNVMNMIVDKFKNDGRWIWDLKIRIYNKSMIVPLVFIHETGIFVLTSYSDEQMFKKNSLEIYRWFQKQYHINLNVMYVIGLDSTLHSDENEYQIIGHCYHMGRNMLREVDIIEFLKNYLKYEYHVIDHQNIDSLEMEILKDVKDMKSIQGPHGNQYVLKNGYWYQCLDLDADWFYEWMVFGGCLGTHKFILGQRMTGIIYVLTFGMLGIGWFFDCLSALLGIYKYKNSKFFKSIGIKLKRMFGYVVEDDEKGKEFYYLDVLSDLKKKVIAFVVMTLINGGLAFLYIRLLNHYWMLGFGIVIVMSLAVNLLRKYKEYEE